MNNLGLGICRCLALTKRPCQFAFAINQGSTASTGFGMPGQASHSRRMAKSKAMWNDGSLRGVALALGWDVSDMCISSSSVRHNRIMATYNKIPHLWFAQMAGSIIISSPWAPFQKTL